MFTDSTHIENNDAKHSPRWSRKADERPEAIYSAALKLFTEQGFRKTKLEDVAKLAGVSKALIYRYFENKEDLLKKSILAKRERLRTEVWGSIESCETPTRSLLQKLILELWERWKAIEYGKLYLLMSGELKESAPELFIELYQMGPICGRHFLENYIQKGIEKGLWRADLNANAAARLIHTAFSNPLFYQIHQDLQSVDPWDAQAYLKNTLNILLDGMEKK